MIIILIAGLIISGLFWLTWPLARDLAQKEAEEKRTQEEEERTWREKVLEELKAR
jgi:hypothetical protein